MSESYEAAIIRHKADINQLVVKIDSLRAENDKLREALEFYADPDKWVSPNFSHRLLKLTHDVTPEHGWLVAEKALGTSASTTPTE